jgi:hypothetical protein
LVLDRDSLAFDALLDTTALSLVGRDRLGALVADAAARTTYVSTNPGVIDVTPGGATRSVGNGTALVIAQSADGPADSVRVLVEQRVASIAVSQDTVAFDALRADRGLGAEALDRLGSVVGGASISYSVDDAAIARVDTGGLIVAVGNGTTQVRAQASGVTTVVAVRVAQKPVRVIADTIHFAALGDTATIVATALDSLGSTVAGSPTGLSVADTSVVTPVDSATVRARANGSVTVGFSVAGLAGTTVVQVRQIARTMTAQLNYAKPIVTLAVGAAVPIQCQGFDANGFAVPDSPVLEGTRTGTVAGATCGDVRVAHSGYDTLTFTVGTARSDVPLIIAAAPIPDSPAGQVISADSLLAPTGPWAPSVNQLPSGEWAVYYAAFSATKDSTGHTRGDLHRLIWLGGNQFRYDGMVLRHDDDICSPQGQGLENTVVMPRSDSAGWRMLYAAGSNTCYGWQVFSAVSPDGRNWTKEAGVRLGNGGVGSTFPPPWPAGEGLVIDRLPSGEWRAIAGTFEHVSPPETNKWQITEWRSSDQINWTYVGTVLTTRDMPAGWQGSVYSPTIRPIAQGLWRMLFTADGRGTPGSRSAIWSAVSTDRTHWQLEGEVLGASATNLFYSALLGDLVVFIRSDGGGQRLSIATVLMP